MSWFREEIREGSESKARKHEMARTLLKQLNLALKPKPRDIATKGSSKVLSTFRGYC